MISITVNRFAWQGQFGCIIVIKYRNKIIQIKKDTSDVQIYDFFLKQNYES